MVKNAIFYKPKLGTDGGDTSLTSEKCPSYNYGVSPPRKIAFFTTPLFTMGEVMNQSPHKKFAFKLAVATMVVLAVAVLGYTKGPSLCQKTPSSLPMIGEKISEVTKNVQDETPTSGACHIERVHKPDICGDSASRQFARKSEGHSDQKTDWR